MSPTVAAILADISESAMAEALRDRGWTVTRKSAYDWETPSAFSVRHGRHKDWFSSRIWRKDGTIPDFEKELSSKGGRLMRLRSNPELEAFANIIEKHHDKRTTSISQAEHSGAKSVARTSLKGGSR